jgi:hexokinase
MDMNMSQEKRSYPRKSCFLPVNYATADRAYQEFIQDISTSGAFIETRHLLSVGQNIAMTFSLPSSQKNIKINGSIARTTSQGLGIAFMVQDAAQKEFMNSKIANI